MSVHVFHSDALKFTFVGCAEKKVSHANKTASWYFLGVVFLISDIFIAEYPGDVILP